MAMTQTILIRSDEKRQKSKRRSRRSRKGFYSSDELIKLWWNKKSQECPPLPAVVMKVHEVHEKGDQLKEKVIFPIQKEKDELPQEVKNFRWKKVDGLLKISRLPVCFRTSRHRWKINQCLKTVHF